MKTTLASLIALLALTHLVPLNAQVPQYISYQGRITAAGSSVPGPTGQFKFAILNQNSVTTFWSHDESSINGSEPATFLTLRITDGLFTVLLGETIPAIPGVIETPQPMKPIRQTIFANANTRLRIWFRKDSSEPTFTLLAPDQKIGASAYSMMSYDVINGAIGSNKITDGAVTVSKLAPDAVARSLPPELNLGKLNTCGLLNLYSTDEGMPGLTLKGCESQISALIQNSGVEGVLLKAADQGGLLTLRAPSSRLATQLSSSAQGGGASWYNQYGRITAMIDGSSSSGFAGAGNGYVRVADSNGLIRVEFLGTNSGGVMQVRNSLNARTLILNAEGGADGGGDMSVGNRQGQTRLYLAGNHNGGGIINAMDTNGTVTAEIIGAESGSTGGKIRVRQADGKATVSMDGDASGQGGWVAVYNNEGLKTIELDGKASDGKSRITTQVLEITGGADLSENFDVTSLETKLTAGMIVCIDPTHPGRLVTSSKAYDNTVAGIVSGAGGVSPGMLMGQHGTAATGKHPVALAGRVYCWVDADRGAIQPGDLITTSDIPGHGMKATSTNRSPGAILGKAMTGLGEGKGLVLVLVSLQ